MIHRQPSRFSHGVVVILGILFLGLGVTTLLYPDIMRRYGVEALDPHGASTIMAVLGGTEIGLGMFLLVGKKLGIAVSSQLFLMLFLFVGILSARVLGAIRFYTELPDMFLREFMIELAIVIFVAIGVRCSRPMKS